jgi:formylglycine-generating enzyme required for sulfatase activity
MTEKLQSILEAEGLSALLGKFNTQGVTDSILSDLTDADLKELDIDKLGERKRLLAAFGKSGGSAAAVSVVEESAPQAASSSAASNTAATPAEATKDSPWVNSLDMPFVPIPRFETRFCVWPVRVQDYEAYCVASGANFPETPFPQESDHPVVGVSWNDAIEFCAWLTGKERAEGKIDDKTVYRLPTDLEWSAAVGLPHEPEATPEERHLRAPGYPWGLRWPPPQNAGNYEHHRKDQLCLDQTAQVAEFFVRREQRSEWKTGYLLEKKTQVSRICTQLFNQWSADWMPVDNFEFTSPVGSFPSNAIGLFDLGGNIWEWCMDSWSISNSQKKVSRGGSFSLGYRETRSFQVTKVDGDYDEKEEFRIDTSIDNRDLYRSSFRGSTPSDKISDVKVHSGLPLINGKEIDESGWRIYPNGGFRAVVAST